MFSFACVIRVANAVVTGGFAGTAIDQRLERLVYREYATRAPDAESEIVCAPSPVLKRRMAPLACPFDEIATA
jgi:hypothetical protein